MIIRSPHRRRAAARLSAAAAVMSAFMLTVSVWSVATGGQNPVEAAATGGTAAVFAPSSGIDPPTPLTNGVTTTPFILQLPPGAACSGDSAAAGYRVQSYIVASTTDPATLTFAPNGRPVPSSTGPNPADSLWRVTSSRFTNGSTDLAVPPSVEGQISGLPVFSWAVFVGNAATVIPPGSYNMGIACTLGEPGPTQLDKFWNVVVDFAVDPADATGIAWTVAADPGTTTTTADPGATTTTGDPGTTTTTGDPGDTTTTTGDPGDTTTTTTVGGSSTTTSGGTGGTSFTGGNPASPSTASTVGQLPYTGDSPWSLVVWGALLVVFGRMAMLLGRKPRVKTPTG